MHVCLVIHVSSPASCPVFPICTLAVAYAPVNRGTCSAVMEQSKGFGVPEILDAEVDGEIVTEDGAPVAAAVAEPKPKAKVLQS